MTHTPVTYGPVPAAIVLVSPIVLIISLGGLIWRQHIEDNKVVEVATFKSQAQQGKLSTPKKGKKKAHQGKRHSNKVTEAAKVKKEMKEARQNVEEEGEQKQEKLNEKDAVEGETNKQSRKEASKKAAENVESKEVVEDTEQANSKAKALEYTKGLPRSKTAGAWRQAEKRGRIGELTVEMIIKETEDESKDEQWTAVLSKKEKKWMKDS